MSKILLFDKDAREKILAGAKTLADAVTTTLGPKGNNVALDRVWGSPAVVHDGVSVAKDIDVDDRFENIGVKLIKQAAVRTGDDVGDGTTTSILETYSLLDKGIKKINEGKNAMIMRKGIEKMSDKVLEEIDKKSIPVKDPQELIRVATISAGDAEIGEKIAEAIAKVGENGLVTVEDSGIEGINIEYKDGMQIDSGYLTALFSNNIERMTWEDEGTDILLVNQRLSSINDIKGMEPYIKSGRHVLMIVSEIEGEALETLIMTSLKNPYNFKCVVVKAQGFGEGQREMLNDIAYLTGATVLSEETGRTLKLLSPDFSEMGKAEKTIVDRDTCQIIGGQGTKEAIEDRISQLKKRIESSQSDYEKEKLSERLAKLSGGVAILKVGALSESETIEKRERAKDALEAVKAAMTEGIVAGGGITLYNIGRSEELQRFLEAEKNEDIRAGMEIVRDTLYEPIKKLLENSGYNEERVSGIVYTEMLGQKDGFGFDIETGEKVDMVEAGIIDPTKVAKLSFKNAISTAISLLTTKCIITDKPDAKRDAETDAIYG